MMNENQCKCNCKVWPIILAVIISSVLAGGGVYYWQSSKAPTTSPNSTVKTDTDTSKIVAYACTQSGGTYKDEKCDCTDKEDAGAKYEKNSGYCIGSFGEPGGELLKIAQYNWYLNNLKNNGSTSGNTANSDTKNSIVTTGNTTYKNSYFSFEYPKDWVTEVSDNNISLFSAERKKEYDNLIKSGKGFGGQIANITIKYTVNYKSNPKKFTDILKLYDTNPKLISTSKINGNNVTKYNVEGYGFDIVYFVEVGNHLSEFTIAKGSNEKVMDEILKTISAVVKS